MLSSKLAFVTGAGSGIGKATALLFAKEGARVIAVDRNADSIKQTLDIITGEGHLALPLDVSSSSQVQKALINVMETYSEPPSVIVNAAGITMDSFLLKMSEDSFDKVLNVNLKGPFFIMQTFMKALKEAEKPGSVVNISSIIAKIGNLGQCNYAASKAGLIAMTKSAAKEFGKFNIRCNSVLPGFIDTPMLETIPDKVKDKFKSSIPLERLGAPQEVAEVILFLASDRSSYVTGTTIDVTGGAS